MKTRLTRDLINNLRFDAIPILANKRTVTQSKPNTAKTPYIVYDTELSGLGVRVGKTSKVYLIQVRIGTHVRKAIVGKHPEVFLGAHEPEREVRQLAAAMLLKLRRGEPVNEKLSKSDVPTLDEAFDNYLESYKSRPLPPKKNTLVSVEAARKKLQSLAKKPIDTVSIDEVRVIFLRVAKTEGHQTAAEHVLHWLSAVYRFALKRERHLAQQEGRQPRFNNNPALALKEEGLVRTQAQLRREHERKGFRRPIPNERDQLGKWFETLWSRRKRYRTQVDYLLMTLLLGARRSETASLQWFDRLISKERSEAGYVDLARKIIFVPDTKNRGDLSLPLGPIAMQWLRERHDLVSGKFVFPVVNRGPTTKIKHYSSPSEFIATTSRLSGVKFTMHDLRRTLATVATGMDIPSIVVARLLNHTPATVTGIYATPSLEELRKYMPRIEAEVFKHASFVKHSTVG
jgi:hypothetical protein